MENALSKQVEYTLSKQGMVIKKTSVDIIEVKKDLTVKPILLHNYTDKIESFPLFEEGDENIIVPKFWGLKKYNLQDMIPLSGKKLDLHFKGQLRDYQNDVLKVVYPLILNKGGGIISLPCGDGKTCIAINIITKLNVPTLVIVNKAFLLDQWMESIKKFTNASVGIIQGNKIEVDGCDIVIGMLQSLSMKDYHHSVFDRFDMVIIDEVHNVATKVFSKALAKINPTYSIGLSATPRRDDGLSKVFNWYLGDMLYKKPKTKNNIVEVEIVKFKSTHPKFKEVRNQKGDIILPIMMSNLAMLEDRNDMIIQILQRVMEEEDKRNILILSNRIEQLEYLKNGFDQLHLPFTTSMYVGKMKQKDLKIAETKQIIFSTYAMTNEGFNVDKLNCLVMAGSRSKIEQAVGRILRVKDPEIAPLIIDIVDELPVFKNQGYKRKKHYQTAGYNIKDMSV